MLDHSIAMQRRARFDDVFVRNDIDRDREMNPDDYERVDRFSAEYWANERARMVRQDEEDDRASKLRARLEAANGPLRDEYGHPTTTTTTPRSAVHGKPKRYLADLLKIRDRAETRAGKAATKKAVQRKQAVNPIGRWTLV